MGLGIIKTKKQSDLFMLAMEVIFFAAFGWFVVDILFNQENMALMLAFAFGLWGVSLRLREVFPSLRYEFKDSKNKLVK
jgi:hypothetical protein